MNVQQITQAGMRREVFEEIVNRCNILGINAGEYFDDWENGTMKVRGLADAVSRKENVAKEIRSLLSTLHSLDSKST